VAIKLKIARSFYRDGDESAKSSTNERELHEITGIISKVFHLMEHS